MSNEIYYCGSCKRQQTPEEGIKCKICNCTTVTWSSNESAAQVHEKWKRINGK